VARLRAGEVIVAATLEEVLDDVDRSTLTRLGTKSVITIPLSTEGRTTGAMTFAAVRQAAGWTLDVVTRLRLVAQILANTLARKHADDTLRQSTVADAAMRERLQEENAYLRRELSGALADSPLAGHSAPMRTLAAQIREAAGTTAPVLLIGEPGVGKTAVAARIHALSARSQRPIIRLRCSTVSASHLERDLAGRESTLSAAAPAPRTGLALADISTLYLDEVADLPLDAQALLTRVLWDGAPAANRLRAPIDARLIADTSRNLMRAVGDGTFREDLYFRLSAVPIRVPPLRDRLEDVPLLVWRFVDEFSDAYRKPIDTVDPRSVAALQAYHWPGNIRELRNVVERAMIIATERHLRIPLPAGLRAPDATLAAVEKEHIVSVLTACDWRIEGDAGAAARLGLTPQALRTRLRRLRIERPRS
jgi:transcriptional regulator with GAF, ATPase, and Fis domain